MWYYLWVLPGPGRKKAPIVDSFISCSLTEYVLVITEGHALIRAIIFNLSFALVLNQASPSPNFCNKGSGVLLFFLWKLKQLKQIKGDGTSICFQPLKYLRFILYERNERTTSLWNCLRSKFNRVKSRDGNQSPWLLMSGSCHQTTLLFLLTVSFSAINGVGNLRAEARQPLALILALGCGELIGTIC